MARKHTPASAATVRAFAVEKGLPGADRTERRGRLNPAWIAAYNKGKPEAAHYKAGVRDVRTASVPLPHVGKDGRTRTRKVTVNVDEARAYGIAQGLSTGKGRVPSAVLTAFAQSTLSTPEG